MKYYSLVTELQIVTATTPRPVLVQLVRPRAAGTATGGELAIATSTGDEARHTSSGQCVDEGHFRGSCEGRRDRRRTTDY